MLIKDGCVVEDGDAIPADTTVPPFTRISRTGGWKELPPAITVELQDRSRQYYHDFAQQQRARSEKTLTPAVTLVI